MISMKCIDSGLVIPEVLHLFGTSMLMRLKRRSTSLMVGSEREKKVPKNIIIIKRRSISLVVGCLYIGLFFFQDELLMAER